MATSPPSPSEPPSSPAAPPSDLTSFVGRESEVTDLRRLLTESRLVTLTGAGGSGKSRLALEAVGPAAVELGVEVVWVELAGLEDEALVPRHVADACDLREEVRGGDPAVLAGFLRARPLLLVLDNCEHLVEGCAGLAHVLLRSCPALRIVATSREALGVPGERAWLVPALSVPPDGTTDPESVGGYEAVRLFCERARDAVASWELTGGNAGAVAEICRRLDGMPLAIELAAARVRVLSPEQIRDRLDDAFRLLTAGGRTSLPRHRTLRAAMDWSHDLLGERERSLLRRLSAFRGGFTLDAVEAVGGGGAVDPDQVLEVLARLVDRSLVTVRDQGGEARYALLETVRQYAAGKLGESDEEDAVGREHAGWVARLVEEAEPHLTRRERPAWVARLAAELDNLREALRWTRVHEPERHVDLVGRLWWFWFSTQHWTEAARWLEEALALPEAARPGPERARLLFAAGALAALRARSGEARPLLEEAASLAEAAGDQRLHAYALNYLGMTWAGDRDPRGREPCERARAWFEAEGDLYGLRLALLLLGTSALAEGDLDRAEALNREGVVVARRFGLDRELSVSLQNLAAVHLVRGDVDRAEPALREGLAASRRDPSHYFIALGLQYAAEVLGHRGEVLEAARILGAAEAARERVGAGLFGVDRARLEAVLPGFRTAAGEEAFEEARAEGRGWAPLDAVERVLVGRGAAAGPSRGAEGAGGSAAVPSPGSRRDETPAAEGEVPLADPGPRGSVRAAAHYLRVRALGDFDVRVEGEAVPAEAWPYVKPRELLVLLLLHPRGRSRDQIAEALWPDAAPVQSRNSFHVTVHHLRKALGRPEWIEREGDRYRVAAGAAPWFDARVFEDGLRAALRGEGGGRGPADRADGEEAPRDERVGALDTALGLYGGDLMEGEAVGPWLEEHRDRLRALYVDGALARGRLHEEEGRWSEAAELYATVVPREELNEELHRRLMRCWAEAGHRPRALRHYERVETLLRDAFDAEPESATRELAESLRTG